MAAVVDFDCLECGQRHTLCLPDAEAFTDRVTYEYVCPIKAVPVRFDCPDEYNRVDAGCPKDSVQVGTVKAN